MAGTMKILERTIVWFIAAAMILAAQVVLGVRYDTTGASGTCNSKSVLWWDNVGGTLYGCKGTAYISIGGGGGGGTVTSFSSGNLSPLFTTSVASPTTTPALSFSLSSQSQNLFYASPNGSSGSPAFRAIVNADLPGSGSVTANGQTCTLGSTCDVNSGATAHGLALNQGNGNAITGLVLGAHQTTIGTAASDPNAKTIPDCTDTGGNHLNFTQSTDAFSCGTSGGGGGSVAAPYVTDGSGNKYLPSPIGGLLAITTPGAASWSWDNQGTASITNTNGALYMLAPGNSGNALRVYYTSAAGAHFTVTTYMAANIDGKSGGGSSGICMRESSSGKIVTWQSVGSAASVSGPLNGLAWTTSTSVNSGALNTAYSPGTNTSQSQWAIMPALRLIYDGTNVIFEVSYDMGVTWLSAITKTATLVFTTAPDQGCLVAWPNTGQANPTYFHWTNTTP